MTVVSQGSGTRAGVLPLGVHGSVEHGYESVAAAFAATLRDGERGGGALTVKVHGRSVIDVWGGWADRNRTRAWTHETPALSFSTTKGVTSTVIHRLHDRGLVDYQAPVAEYWPEFGARGKGNIKIFELMSHQAGLYDARSLIRRPEDALDHIALEDRLAAAKAQPTAGHPAYHALTYGWLLAGVARRITGKGMAELYQTEIAEPLSITGVHLGRPRTGEPAAEFVGSLRMLGARATSLLLPLGAYRISPSSRLVRALAPDGVISLFEGDRPAVLETEMGAANGVFTASALAEIYGSIANPTTDGTSLLSPTTVYEMSRLQTSRRDLVLAIPMGWRIGYHQVMTAWPRTKRGFGHYGLGGSAGFAEPDLGMSFGYVTNRIDPSNLVLGNLTTVRLADAALKAVKRESR